MKESDCKRHNFSMKVLLWHSCVTDRLALKHLLQIASISQKNIKAYWFLHKGSSMKGNGWREYDRATTVMAVLEVCDGTLCFSATLCSQQDWRWRLNVNVTGTHLWERTREIQTNGRLMQWLVLVCRQCSWNWTKLSMLSVFLRAETHLADSLGRRLAVVWLVGLVCSGRRLLSG